MLEVENLENKPTSNTYTQVLKKYELSEGLNKDIFILEADLTKMHIWRLKKGFLRECWKTALMRWHIRLSELNKEMQETL